MGECLNRDFWGLGSWGWVGRIGEPGMGSRCHGNDGGGWLVSLRRAGEGGFQTRPYRSRCGQVRPYEGEEGQASREPPMPVATGTPRG